jgi:hypothetical protein
MLYETQFLRALAATVAIETAVLWAAVRLVPAMGAGTSAARLLGAGALCSSATLPWLWFVLPAYVQSRALFLGIGESAVTVAEGLILAGMLPVRLPRAMALSAACNGISWAVGYLWMR